MSYPLQQIDLYVSEIRVDQDWLDFQFLMKSLGVLAVVMTIWTAGLFWSLYSSESEANTVNRQLTNAKKSLEDFGLNIENAKKSNADLPDRIEAARKDLENKQKLLSYIATQKIDQEKGFSSVLSSLAMQATPGLWLTRIAIADSGKGMQLEGKTIDPASVPNYLRKLTKEAAIAGRNFDVMTFDRDVKDAHLMNFLLRSGEVQPLEEKKTEEGEGAHELNKMLNSARAPEESKKEISVQDLLLNATKTQ